MRTSLDIHDFAGQKILVVGEAILDKYHQGTTQRISREAPVPVVSSASVTSRGGGAANTAANIVAMGSKATLVFPVGPDDTGRTLIGLCEKNSISCEPVLTSTPTPIKTRVLSAQQQLLRIDECPSLEEHAEKIAEAAIKALKGHHALIISDYGLGVMEHAATIINAAREAQIPVVVDPRGKDWSRYRRASLVAPNLDEIADADGFTTESLEERAQALMARHEIESILVTQGADGMAYHEKDAKPILAATRSVEVFDVTGAGDTVVAMLALGLVAKGDIVDIMRWANNAAGIVVGKFGAAVATPEELVSEPGGHGGKVMELDGLLAELDRLKKDGNRIVMTNGCFDIIHAGHLETLAAASRLGDCLVVCVNDDESIARLKGPGRPVVPINERLQVIAGLGCVDYAIDFSSDNATELVRKIRPDAYVKGGDWKDKSPPEAKVAEEIGAQIVYVALRPHLSTTEIIRKIKDEQKGN